MAPHIRLCYPQPVIQGILDVPAEWVEEFPDVPSETQEDSSRQPPKRTTEPRPKPAAHARSREETVVSYYSSSSSTVSCSTTTSSRASSRSGRGQATQNISAQRCDELRQGLRKCLLKELEGASGKESNKTLDHSVISKWCQAPDSFYAAFLRFAGGPSSGETSGTLPSRKRISSEPKASKVAQSKSLPTPGSLGFKGGARLEQVVRCGRSHSSSEQGICRSASQSSNVSLGSAGDTVPWPRASPKGNSLLSLDSQQSAPSSPALSGFSSFCTTGDPELTELENELMNLNLRSDDDDIAYDNGESIKIEGEGPEFMPAGDGTPSDRAAEVAVKSRALAVLLRFVKFLEDAQSQGFLDMFSDERRVEGMLSKQAVVALPPSVVDAGGCRVVLVVLRNIARVDHSLLAKLVGWTFLQLCADPAMNANGICMVYDVSGVTIQDACKLLRMDFGQICPHGCFPLRTRRLVVTHQPHWFGLLWRSVQKVLNHKRRSQIHILGSDIEALERIIPQARVGLTPFLGQGRSDGGIGANLVESWQKECTSRGHLLSWLPLARPSQ